MISTLESISQAEADQKSAELETYARCVHSMANNPVLPAPDAVAFKKTITALGLSVDEAKADVAAVVAVAAAQKSMVAASEIEQLAAEHADAGAALKQMVEIDHPAQLLAAQTKRRRAAGKRGSAESATRDAVETIRRLKQEHPRAFGVDS